jgi:hypothetical protein
MLPKQRSCDAKFGNKKNIGSAQRDIFDVQVAESQSVEKY